MDRSWGEADSKEGKNGGLKHDADKKQKTNKTFLNIAGSTVQTHKLPFSSHEITFWDVQKLDPDGPECDILIGQGEVMGWWMRGDREEKPGNIGGKFLAVSYSCIRWRKCCLSFTKFKLTEIRTLLTFHNLTALNRIYSLVLYQNVNVSSTLVKTWHFDCDQGYHKMKTFQ